MEGHLGIRNYVYKIPASLVSFSSPLKLVYSKPVDLDRLRFGNVSDHFGAWGSKVPRVIQLYTPDSTNGLYLVLIRHHLEDSGLFYYTEESRP